MSRVSPALYGRLLSSLLPQAAVDLARNGLSIGASFARARIGSRSEQLGAVFCDNPTPFCDDA